MAVVYCVWPTNRELSMKNQSLPKIGEKMLLGVEESPIFPRKIPFQNKNVFSFQRNAQMLFLAKWNKEMREVYIYI